MRIYTKTGDKGETGLYGGARLPKYSIEIEAIGDVDELNSIIGVIVSSSGGDALTGTSLQSVQHRLFTIGANLAAVAISTGKENIPKIVEEDILGLEVWIDRMQEQLEPIRQFILPGGCPAAAQCFFARAICRRAERRVAELASKYPALDPLVLQYVNRLSDVLFVLARFLNHASGVADVGWVK